MIVTGLLPAVGFVIFVVLVATVTPSEGWPPRLMFLTYAPWIITVGTRFRGVATTQYPSTTIPIRPSLPRNRQILEGIG
jgi:uncharacterized membrane protein YjgN (DUF898 family)